MKIAQVAPLYESVPPKLYGGTERVVSYLTEELVALGHDVTLFATADSKTRAGLVAIVGQGLRLSKDCRMPDAHHYVMFEQVLNCTQSFDIIHFHTDYLHFGLARRLIVTPHVTTLHGRLDIPDLKPLYEEFWDIPLVSISDAQRKPLSFAGWRATVHHGIPEHAYGLDPAPKGYLAFLGRISPEKRVDLAIEIARRTKTPIRIAAKVDKADAEYFAAEIEPLLDGPLVEWVGEIGEDVKGEFLGGAAALLFPIDWPEPFGLVMIEAMACGTPVVAFRRGSVPEVLEDRVTGFIVDDLEQAIGAVAKIHALDRARIRQEFEKRFTARRMAGDYLSVYEGLIRARKPAAAVG
ncbi:MAG: glycosyltransferase family 4 protein [Burkholderiales bacterium]